MELPRLENGVLDLGGPKLSLLNSNLDDLILTLGDPEGLYPLETESRFKIFEFNHPSGKLFAFVFFKDGEAPVEYEIYPGLEEQDRGLLVELHLELDSAIALKKLGKPGRQIQQEHFKFVVFKEICLARLLNQKETDGISFLNPTIIPQPERSFMYALNFWPGAKFPISYDLMIQWLLDQADSQNEPEY